MTRGDIDSTRRELLKKGAVLAGASATGIAATSGTAVAGCTGMTKCVRTQGYWKNHLESWVTGTSYSHVHICGRTILFAGNKNTLNKYIFGMPSRGNKLHILGKQYLAAKLNLAHGAENCRVKDEKRVYDYVKRAENYLNQENGVATKGGNGNDFCFPSSQQWPGDAEMVKNVLERYNQGKLCAPPCE